MKNEKEGWSVNVIRPVVSVSHKVKILGLSFPMITFQRNGFQVLEEDISGLWDILTYISQKDRGRIYNYKLF